MKYANVYWDNPELNESNYRAVNIGNHLQFMAIDYLFQKYFPKEEVVKLQLSELVDYTGETLILPMDKVLFDSNWMREDRIMLSDKIIPVFLAITIESAAFRKEFFNDYNIAYIKRYEPIGCRDEYTMNTLHSYGINAYLNGCLTSAFPKRESGHNAKKVFLVDVPIEVEKEIDEIIQNIKEQYWLYTRLLVCSYQNIGSYLATKNIERTVLYAA